MLEYIVKLELFSASSIIKSESCNKSETDLSLSI